MGDFNLQCPIPATGGSRIQVAHGGGGRMSQRLLDEVFFAQLANPSLDQRLDASIVDFAGRKLAVSTDGFVVTPRRFPGGDIGSLAVHGTVNDLAMSGARPIALTAAFVLEEGLAIDELGEYAASLQSAAQAAGVAVVAGDTKVVERGRGDGLYIVTTGIGEVVAPGPLGPASIRDGDAILVSGDIGRHGAAVMSVREGIALDEPVLSDSASVLEPVLALLEAGIGVHCMRDPTRGGVASVLNELARDGGRGVTIVEASVPVQEDVAGISELLGLDPLYMACEGRFLAIVAADDAAPALEVMRRFRVSAGAVQIGRIEGSAGEVAMISRIGVSRILDLLSGEQLPRIC